MIYVKNLLKAVKNKYKKVTKYFKSQNIHSEMTRR